MRRKIKKKTKAPLKKVKKIRAKTKKQPLKRRLSRKLTSKRKPAKRLRRITSKVKRQPVILPEVRVDLKPEAVLKTETESPPQYIPEYIPKKEETLPSGYGDNKIVLMVRDPWTIFAYWEITPEREFSLKSDIERQGHRIEKSILRVYDISGRDFDKQAANSYFDLELKNLANNWYIHVGPLRSWCADIGIKTYEGKFFTLARSNRVDTPRFGISDVIDEEWAIREEDYWKIFTGLKDLGKSSLEMRERFERWIKEQLFLGVSSPIRPK